MDEDQGSNTGLIISIIVGIIVLAIIIGLIIYFTTRKPQSQQLVPIQPPFAPIQPPPSPTPQPPPVPPPVPPPTPPPTPQPSPPGPVPLPKISFPCPPGWTGIGSSTNPCKNGNSSLELDGKDLKQLRDYAKSNGIISWPGMLCPDGWDGIGTEQLPCVNANSKYSGYNFDTPYYDNPTEYASFTASTSTVWDGVACPLNWVYNTVKNECVPTKNANNSKCESIEYDKIKTFDDLSKKVSDCEIKDTYYLSGLYV